MRKINIAIALLLASFQFSAYALITEARAVVVKGTVTDIAPSSSTETPVVRDAEIQVGSTIGTAEKSSLLMQPTPGAAVMVLEKSSVVLTEDDLKKTGETIIGKKTILNLRKGAVEAALLHPNGGGVDFKIKTPQCVAAARGTVYGVSVSPDGNSTTIVTSAGSSVTVTWVVNGQLQTVTVGPNQTLTVNSDGSSNAVNVGTVANPDYIGQVASLAQENSLADFVEVSVDNSLLPGNSETVTNATTVANLANSTQVTIAPTTVFQNL